MTQDSDSGTDDPGTDNPETGDPDIGDSAPESHPGSSSATRSSSRSEKEKPGCFKVGCLTVLSMLLVIALAIGGIALYVNHQLGKVQQSNSLLPQGGPSRDAAAGEAQNILLLGSDSRGTDLRANGRSDVIQLMHISSDKRSVQVVHFPRDLYVDIPGRGKNKINAAYAFGGPKLVVSTLQNLLNVKIDHVAQIGFDGFTKLTDAMGGVQIYVSQAYSGGDTGTWSKGYHEMNGQQALGFARQRKQLSRGDIDRGVNQQQWISGMATKALSSGTLKNPKKVLDMVSAIAPYMLVDMSTKELIQLGAGLRNVRKDDISFYTAPFSGFARNEAGAVDVVDMPKMKQLGTSLRTDTMSKTSIAPNTVG